MLVRPMRLERKTVPKSSLADRVTNLRDDILINRLKYALTSMEEDRGIKFIQKARKALEK